MSKKVTMAAQLTGVKTLKDRSLNLSFNTRELGGEDSAVLFNLAHTEGWLLFSANDDIEATDIPDEKADSMTGQKTQAQRLRGVIYRLWEQNGAKGNSEDYYRSQMEVLIDFVKGKLE